MHSSLNALRDDDKWSKLLSHRERQVALLVARGFSNKEIARELRLSCGTVKVHMHSIFQKLGTKRPHSLIFMIHTSSVSLSR